MISVEKLCRKNYALKKKNALFVLTFFFFVCVDNLVNKIEALSLCWFLFYLILNVP